jgi:biopolymer transport protein ExbD
MKKIIVLALVLIIFPINISYSLEDVKLKLPQGSTGEIYRAKAGHNYYTVVKVDGREQVMFANQYSLERWSAPAGTFHTRDDVEQRVKNGDVIKLREKSKDKVPDEVNIKADGTVEVVSWQEP